MNDKQTDPALNPFTAHLFERVAVRPLKVFRASTTNDIVEYEPVQDLGEADLVSVYAYYTTEVVNGDGIPSIWLADFDPGMMWAIPGFVDGLGLLVHYEFATPDPANFCDSVTNKENDNE